jgi:hypothetical protein
MSKNKFWQRLTGRRNAVFGQIYQSATTTQLNQQQKTSDAQIRLEIITSAAN